MWTAVTFFTNEALRPLSVPHRQGDQEFVLGQRPGFDGRDRLFYGRAKLVLAHSRPATMALALARSLSVKGQGRLDHHLQGIPPYVGPHLPGEGDKVSPLGL